MRSGIVRTVRNNHASAVGSDLQVVQTDESPSQQEEILREMRLQFACGIVLLAGVESSGLHRAVEEGEPVALVNRHFSGVFAASFIGANNPRARSAVVR